MCAGGGTGPRRSVVSAQRPCRAARSLRRLPTPPGRPEAATPRSPAGAPCCLLRLPLGRVPGAPGQADTHPFGSVRGAVSPGCARDGGSEGGPVFSRAEVGGLVCGAPSLGSLPPCPELSRPWEDLLSCSAASSCPGDPRRRRKPPGPQHPEPSVVLRLPLAAAPCCLWLPVLLPCCPLWGRRGPPRQPSCWQLALLPTQHRDPRPSLQGPLIQAGLLRDRSRGSSPRHRVRGVGSEVLPPAGPRPTLWSVHPAHTWG